MNGKQEMGTIIFVKNWKNGEMLYFLDQTHK